MIKYVKGDIFNSTANLLVNPVNSVGIMGAGLARQFKNRYPVMFKDYKEDCKKGLYVGGSCKIYGEVACLATKQHWKDPSQLRYITDGLRRLWLQMYGKKITSVAIPRLGCGLGGLDWDDVKQLIEFRFRNYHKIPNSVLFLMMVD